MTQPSEVRTWTAGERLPTAQRLALAAAFVALGTVLGYASLPVGPARVAPFQATVNVIAGVLLGPWYAVLVAFGISVLRNALGAGTFLAFPGSMFGAFLVGYVYQRTRRAALATCMEPIGTAIIGGIVGYLLIAPLEAPVALLGFIAANPPSRQPYLGVFVGALALIVSFALSSVPGAVLGWICLNALRRAGIGLSSREASH
jgi:energy coupling factor transporter S component ThiW